MTAETFTTVVRPPSTFSLDKYERGSAPLTAAAVTALGAVTTATTVAEVLDILSTVTKADYVVADDSMGRATSVLT